MAGMRPGCLTSLARWSSRPARIRRWRKFESSWRVAWTAATCRRCQTAMSPGRRRTRCCGNAPKETTLRHSPGAWCPSPCRSASQGQQFRAHSECPTRPQRAPDLGVWRPALTIYGNGMGQQRGQGIHKRAEDKEGSSE
eukprot:XP_001700606.1 predicted protein [Chlamydomonas reinhardtii]